MEKVNKIVTGILLVVTAGIALGGCALGNKAEAYEDDGTYLVAKTERKQFYVFQNGEWKPSFLKGVNMGAAKPGHFPGELAITKEEYTRWFSYISDMHADVIRVYTTMKPEFYEALYEFNRKADKPLYLMQGVYLNEELTAEWMDAYANEGAIKEAFLQDTLDLVDVLHGEANLPERRGYASGKYTKDVSPYVVGWMLGVEWDPEFVSQTNENNPEKNSFEGNWLRTEGASPFEVFLADVGDEVLNYELSEYQMSRPLSFTNWLTTDPLEHPNEPDSNEDRVSVNTEHILAQEQLKSGLFATYHVYPYYPDFLNFQPEYVAFKDEEGKTNTYKAYLKDLIKEHTVPVMVGEFGIPASRGKAHESVYSGFHQGNVTEEEQGKMITDMLLDIYEEGYAGGLVFSWQDEWFKRTWNTMDFDFPASRPFWSNVQTNEQHFGLLAFDPGEEKSVAYVDGNVEEWSEDDLVLASTEGKLYAKSDERALYLMVDAKQFDFDRDQLHLAVDLLDGQGNTEDAERNLRFSRPTDFLIEINGKTASRILVDAYYDSFYYLYGSQLKIIEENPAFTEKDSGRFNPIYLALSNELYLPVENRIVPFQKYETGQLQFGNANPENAAYNSLADFIAKDGHVELAIPWQLLNFMDPSTKKVMENLYEKSTDEDELFSSVSIEKLNIGFSVTKNGEASSVPIEMGSYTWDNWTMPTYHERLKPSYYILQETFQRLNTRLKN